MLILIIAAVTRIVSLHLVPPALNWDEVAMGYTAHSLAETGADEWGVKAPLFFRSYGEWKSAVYIYLLVPFVKIFGLNAWGVRLPTSIAGVISVYLTYLIAKKLYSEKSALWAALFIAVSPWHMLLSRPAYEAGVSLALMLGGIYYLILASESKSLKYIIYSAVLFGLGPHTYNSSKIIVPFLILWLIYTLWKQFSKKNLVIFFTILLIFAAPIIENIRSGKAQHRYSQVGVTTDIVLTEEFFGFRKTFPFPEDINKLIFNRYTFFAYKLTDNWLTYFSPAFLITSGGGHTQHGIPYRGVLYITEFALGLYGLTLLKKSKHKLKYLPIIILVLGFIPPATTRETFHVLRSILAIPGWQILAGLGAAKLLTPKSNSTHKVIIFLSLEILIFMFSYFSWYPKLSARDWQYGYKEAFAYVDDIKDKYDKVAFTKWYGEPQIFLGFYEQMDPEYYQAENIKLLRYEQEGKLWLDQMESYELDGYLFQYIEYQGPDANARTLYIGKEDDFPLGIESLHTIYFPNGKVAFKIVEGR